MIYYIMPGASIERRRCKPLAANQQCQRKRFGPGNVFSVREADVCDVLRNLVDDHRVGQSDFS